MDWGQLTDEQISELCGVSRSTVYRWRTGRQTVPHACATLIRLHRDGRVMPAEWRGWRFDQGRMVTPLREALTAVEIEQRAWVMGMWRQARADNEALQHYCDYLESITPRADVLQFPQRKPK